MDTPTFKFIVESRIRLRTYTARFTNEKHAKVFVKKQRRDGIFEVKMFHLTDEGEVGKEIKIK